MKTLGLTKDGDLRFENGDFVIIEEKDEIVQCLEISFGTSLKEWFLNELDGIEKDLVLWKSTDSEARTEVIRLLAQEERIDTIENVTISTDKVNRVRTAHCVVKLVDGSLLEWEANL